MGPKNSSQQNKIENSFLNNESTIIQDDEERISKKIQKNICNERNVKNKNNR